MPSEEDFKRFMETGGSQLPEIKPPVQIDEVPSTPIVHATQPISERRSLLDVVKDPGVLSSEASRGPATDSGRFSADGFYSKLQKVRDNPEEAPASSKGGRGGKSEAMDFYRKLRGSTPMNEEMVGMDSPSRALPQNRREVSQAPRIALPTLSIDPSTHAKCPNCSKPLKRPKPGWTISCICGKTYSPEHLDK